MDLSNVETLSDSTRLFNKIFKGMIIYIVTDSDCVQLKRIISATSRKSKVTLTMNTTANVPDSVNIHHEKFKFIISLKKNWAVMLSPSFISHHSSVVAGENWLLHLSCNLNMKYLGTLSRYAGCSGSMHDGDGKGADGRSDRNIHDWKSTNLKFLHILDPEQILKFRQS